MTSNRRSSRQRMLVCKLTCLLTCLIVAAFGGCAAVGSGDAGVLIETAARGQPLAGAACTATIDELHWDVATPAVIAVGDARGVLHVVCNYPGYRTSEVIFRPATGGGLRLGTGYEGGPALPLPAPGARYPQRITVDLNPP